MQPKPAAAQPERPRAGRPRLREVPGGDDLEAWPIAVPIHDDETLTSWAGRLAHRYGMSPAALFRALHVKLTYYRLGMVERALVSAENEVGLRTNFSDEARMAHCLKYRDLPRRAWEYHPLIPFLKGSRFCPQCLATAPYWRSAWRDPLNVACPIHHVLLAVVCPACGQEPFATSAWAMNERAVTECPESRPDPQRRARTKLTKCGADLRETQCVEADPATVGACVLLWKGVSEPYGERSAAGLPASNQEAATALTSIVRELASQHSAKPTRDNIRSALGIAYQVLEEPTLCQAVSHAQKYQILRGHLGRPDMITPAPKGTHIPAAHPIIQSLYLESIRDQLPLTMHLTYQLESTWPRAPQGVRVPQPEAPVHFPRWNTPALGFHRVPQLWWADRDEFADRALTDGERFAISLAICNVARSMTLASIAEDLGATKASARFVTRTWRRLAETAGWRSLQSRFVEMAEALHDAPPPINYQRRRDVLPSPEALRMLLPQLGVNEGSGNDELLWMWSLSTQSSCNLIPPQQRENWAKRVTPRTPAPAQLNRISDVLETYFNEPLYWTPP